MRRTRCIHYIRTENEQKKHKWNRRSKRKSPSFNQPFSHSFTHWRTLSLALTMFLVFIFIVWIFLCSFSHLNLSRIVEWMRGRGEGVPCSTVHTSSSFIVVYTLRDVWTIFVWWIHFIYRWCAVRGQLVCWSRMLLRIRCFTTQTHLRESSVFVVSRFCNCLDG